MQGLGVDDSLRNREEYGCRGDVIETKPLTRIAGPGDNGMGLGKRPAPAGKIGLELVRKVKASVE